MRLSTLFFFLLSLILLALGGYIYVERWVPMVEAIDDLKEDNLLLAERLKKLQRSPPPVEVHLPESTQKVLEEEREAMLSQHFAFHINEIFRRNDSQLAKEASQTLKELLSVIADTTVSRVEVFVPAYRRGKDPGYSLAARRAAQLGGWLIRSGLPREKLLIQMASGWKDSVEIRIMRKKSSS